MNWPVGGAWAATPSYRFRTSICRPRLWRNRRSRRSISPSSSSGLPTPTWAPRRWRSAPRTQPVSDSGDQDILLDDLSLPPTTMASSSVIIGMQTTGGRMPSDSDVRLIPDNTAGSGSRPSDSDVRLAPQEFKAASDSDVKPVKPKGKPPGDSDVALRPARRFRRDPDRRRFVGARLALRGLRGGLATPPCEGARCRARGRRRK